MGDTMFKNKKSQTLSITISIFGFWMILALMLTLYNDSPSTDQPISAIGFNNTFFNTNVNIVDVEDSTEAGFFTYYTMLAKFIAVGANFFMNFIGLITIYFPIFPSVVATVLIGSLLLIFKVVTWIIIITSIKNIGG